ncbi:hypothetical protein CAOG_07718 [Capsaspora owczarzaki ATCC 30864]|uniref:Uncharacterized protein n=1 Tax=Capsaspora owczarzaki (strain ATCC 30864) TaxID=595528 RepID=A0A0D2X568_CAPO3|nr:hypothetical protein CAOG_07718 [Capsaspora owczarzaki ATCC 30864]KJE97284.1 hypothetical protein CAOG_007718 [Capsaspora owczarzaki ATCC 30864]|eukprot:XP_004343592.2 hypothetical protein CAOG_07718 [Capsaspora owczarzaki ATCC 30864]
MKSWSNLYNLDEFWLEFNLTEPAMIKAAIDWFQHSDMFECLLSGHRIDDAGAKVIAEALKSNRTLTSIDLSANQIGFDGGQAIAEALKSNGTLTALNLNNNSIGDTGAQAFAEALEHNETLTDLDLRISRIGGAGTKALEMTGNTRCRVFLQSDGIPLSVQQRAPSSRSSASSSPNEQVRMSQPRVEDLEQQLQDKDAAVDSQMPGDEVLEEDPSTPSARHQPPAASAPLPNPHQPAAVSDVRLHESSSAPTMQVIDDPIDVSQTSQGQVHDLYSDTVRLLESIGMPRAAELVPLPSDDGLGLLERCTTLELVRKIVEYLDEHADLTSTSTLVDRVHALGFDQRVADLLEAHRQRCGDMWGVRSIADWLLTYVEECLEPPSDARFPYTPDTRGVRSQQQTGRRDGRPLQYVNYPAAAIERGSDALRQPLNDYFSTFQSTLPNYQNRLPVYLYHGTSHENAIYIFTNGPERLSTHQDFSREGAFCTTTDLRQAIDWARRRHVLGNGLSSPAVVIFQLFQDELDHERSWSPDNIEWERLILSSRLHERLLRQYYHHDASAEDCQEIAQRADFVSGPYSAAGSS